MFYYLGRKKKIANLYPEPEFETIIEPFAGSAAYSLHGERWKKKVILNDLSPITFMIWNYLKQATRQDILSLPNFKPGERISQHKQLTEAEKWLIGFHINPGANQRSDVVTRFNRWDAGKRYIATNLHKIEHWTILNLEYHELDNTRATWFIDPPYQKSGKYYLTNTVQFDVLANWVLARDGQSIVCEQEGASWLPFQPLINISICGRSVSREVVFTHRSVDM